MSTEKRSALMAKIRGKDTGPERALAEALAIRGFACERHAKDLPGRPDFVFRSAMVAVFVDGRFWHGHGFAEWRDKLSEAWEAKIATNIRRDNRNFRALRRLGWHVIRLWDHDIAKRMPVCIARIERMLTNSSHPGGIGSTRPIDPTRRAR